VTASRRRPPAAPSAARIIKAPAPRTRPALYIRKVPGMGRGVFAGRRYRKGDVIEVCPVLPIPRGQAGRYSDGLLDRYLFWWPSPAYPTAIALGYGSIYNHSFAPNARFTPRPVTNTLVFRAAHDIEPGEQIFVDYEWPPQDYHFAAARRRSRP
jgi:SET domain-containing protein